MACTWVRCHCGRRLASILLLHGGHGALLATASAKCPKVEPLPRDSEEGPDELDLVACDHPSLKVGDMCEGDGECGTDKGENNCRNELHSSAAVHKSN